MRQQRKLGVMPVFDAALLIAEIGKLLRPAMLAKARVQEQEAD